MGRLRIGVDSGGTFTDVCVFDEATSTLFVWKIASTPDDPSEAIAAGIAQGLAVMPGNPSPAEIVYFGHGTTVATNALIQGRIATTGLITTAGFRDLLEIRRQRRPELYDLQTIKPDILVSRDKRLEVRERVLFDGTTFTPLNEADVRAAAQLLRRAGVASVAICFLFSFMQPAHEIRAREIVAEEFPEAFVSVSHEIAPEFREFERLSTVVVNAALGPIMQNYLRQLQPRLDTLQITARPSLTQSNGGVISSDTAQAQPVRTVLSGPAAGVMGALAVGRAAGIGNLITFDMGGTSTDVSLIDDFRPQMATDTELHGHPLKLPMLDIHTVGAGGGSIAHLDNGLLKVGPASAGAVPGPVCYGLGNLFPTVTDANVVLGVLSQTHLLGGRMQIEAAASHSAIADLAQGFGLDAMETAQGIIRVVIANMARAIRVISVERGYDPRDYTMLAFGGAGPIHAARLARELDITSILVPRNPGILCAMGLLLTDLRSDFSLTRLTELSSAAIPTLAAGFTQLSSRAQTWFDTEQIPAAQRLTARSIDMRYGGQGYELTIPVPDGPMTHATPPRLREKFEQVHRQTYGYVAAEEQLQITTLRLEATGLVPKADLPRHAPASTDITRTRLGERSLFLPELGGLVAIPLYDRALLQPGHRIRGPALIEQMDSTTLVLPGQIATVDEILNLLLEEQA
jgi:N-methylhydantoinase A